MRICDLEFRDLGEIEFVTDQSGLPLKMRPQDRFSNTNRLALHRYGNAEFCKFCVNNLPKGPGVYAFISGTEVLYIGKASSISKRFMPGYRLVSPRMCYAGGPETTCRINAELLRHALRGSRLQVTVHETGDFDQVEAELLKHVTPLWNRAGVSA